MGNKKRINPGTRIYLVLCAHAKGPTPFPGSTGATTQVPLFCYFPQTTLSCRQIDLLSTRVDSYRHPIDTQTTPKRHPIDTQIPSFCTRLPTAKTIAGIDLLSTRVDSYRQELTWVDKMRPGSLFPFCPSLTHPPRETPIPKGSKPTQMAVDPLGKIKMG